MTNEINGQEYPMNRYTRMPITAGQCGITPDQIPASVMEDLEKFNGAMNESIFKDSNGGCHWRLEAKDGTGTTFHDVRYDGETISYMQSIHDKINTPYMICDWYAPNGEDFEKESCDYFDYLNNEYLTTNIDSNFDGVFEQVNVHLDSHEGRKLPRQ